MKINYNIIIYYVFLQGICETMAGIGYIIGSFLGGALFQVSHFTTVHLFSLVKYIGR